jgi:predicted enzyme related to lactoylglutathione lyase
MRVILGAGLAVILTVLTAPRDLEAQTVPPLVGVGGGDHRTGKFVWFDLVSSDVERAASFYSQVFGWQVERIWGISDYLVFRANGLRIGGITAAERPGEAGWIASLSVGNVDEAAAWVTEQGGSVLQAPTESPLSARRTEIPRTAVRDRAT